jgi:S1-C subfamily serine protease
MRSKKSLLAALLTLLVPATLSAAPSATAPKADPSGDLPAFARKAVAAVIGIKSQIPLQRPSVRTLGHERWGSGVIVDSDGYALTVGYIVLEAERIDVFLRDGRIVPARLIANDFESGIGVIKLDGPGPWPATVLGDSTKVAIGQPAGILGIEEDRRLIVTQGSVKEIKPFAGSWEYMISRAFIVEPYNPAFGGSPLLNASGEVIGITSLRLGDPPFVNLAIPIEFFSAVRDELIAKGRIVSRRPRPWLGLFTLPAEGGLFVARLSPVGPAAQAGLEHGDLIVRLNGEKVESLEGFYQRLWQLTAGEEITLVVLRDSRFHSIRARTMDRQRLYGTGDK